MALNKFNEDAYAALQDYADLLVAMMWPQITKGLPKKLPQVTIDAWTDQVDKIEDVYALINRFEAKYGLPRTERQPVQEIVDYIDELVDQLEHPTEMPAVDPADEF